MYDSKKPHLQLLTNSNSESAFYRVLEKRRIVAGLLSGQSLLVISGTGYGKTTLAKEVATDLVNRGFRAIYVEAKTPTSMILSICEQVGIEAMTLEGRRKANNQIKDEIRESLSNGIGILIMDDADRYDSKFRGWISDLIDTCTVLLLATNPPRKDIFLKTPRIELEPLRDREIREIMLAEADRLGLTIKRSDIAAWQSRVAGNPMLAKKAIREEYLGLGKTATDHTQWIDGTPFLIAILSGLTLIRFLGLGFNSTNLYLLGGILTVSVGVVRLIYYSLPRQSPRLGR